MENESAGRGGGQRDGNGGERGGMKADAGLGGLWGEETAQEH